MVNEGDDLMEYQNKLKIGEMEEGRRYPINQGQGYCDGVMIEKNGDELTFRHFNINNDGEIEWADGQAIVIHKDAILFLEWAEGTIFEDMTLRDAYECQMDLYEKEMDLHYSSRIIWKVRYEYMIQSGSDKLVRVLCS
jgi:hypothetical protein